jgi:hypothetical protein
MPFGAGRRRCPAEHFSVLVAREFVLGIIDALELELPVSLGGLFWGREQLNLHLGRSDLCCVLRRKSLGPTKLMGVKICMGWLSAFEAIKSSLIVLRGMPKNAREAFAEKL